MIIRILIFSFFFAACDTAIGDTRFLMKFSLTEGSRLIERGKTYISTEPTTWSKGLSRSYLQLRCDRNKPNKLTKLYSTIDLFNGLSTKQKIVGTNIEVTVTLNNIQARVDDIRKLGKKDCKELKPIVQNINETYSFPAEAGIEESRSFGDRMKFHFTLENIRSRR